MAIIPLRQYNREIEGLIDTGQLDEAVAHCRHILETFPKHIATYRLLGKAYLEQQRYGDAGDIFQRVLSSIPDDHVANIGLSIIREDEGNLDAAIWYMERALEAQPSNGAIKDELRRLYGRRDGIEPPKIRLTRGALARMYSRGGLYDQAVAELRTALADDPQRPDLMVLLAQMYFNLGQQVEAVDTCGNLIKRLPYCLVANRILAAILPQTGRVDDTKTYQQRAIAMDPYFTTAEPQTLSADNVPEQAINIERLAYHPGQATDGGAQPAWAASLGIAFEESQAEQIPEWLRDQEIPEQKAERGTIPPSVEPFSWETSEDEVIPSETPANVEDIIPDWMKEAGWQPATGIDREGQALTDFESPEEQVEEEIAKADIPDWLRDLAPSGALDEETSPGEGELDASDLPWLQQSTPGASDTIVNWLGAQKPAEAESAKPSEDTSHKTPEIPTESPAPPIAEGAENGGLPDWLKGVEQSYEKSGITDWLVSSHVDELEAASETTEPTGKETTEPSEEIPEWLKEMGEATLGPAEPAEELPDWLAELGEPQAEHAPPVPTEKDSAVHAEELPDWVSETGESETEPVPAGSGEEEPIATDEEAPEWLREISAPEAEPAIVEHAEEELAVPAEELPEWLKELGEPEAELASAEHAEEEPAVPAEELPEWLKEMGEPEAELAPAELVEEEPAVPAEELPEWLKEMGEPEAELASAELVEEEPGAVADELPEWLKEMGEPEAELAPAELAEEEPAILAEELPEGLEEMDETEAIVAPTELVEEEPAEAAEELPDWLKEMGEPEAELASTELVEEEPAVPAEELPEWLKEMGEPEAELAPAELVEEEPAVPAEELPEWLKEMDETEAMVAPTELVEEEPAVPAEELPEWLKEMGEPEAELAPAEPAEEEPTVPTEELPEWLDEMGGPEAELAPAELAEEESTEAAEELPEWLKEMGEAEVELASAEHAEETISPTEELPEKFAEMGMPEAEPTPVESAREEPALPAEVLPEWHKEISESEAALTPSEPSEEEPALPAEELPDWYREVGEPEVELASVESSVEEPVTPAEAIIETPEKISEPAEVVEPPELADEELVLPGGETPSLLQETAELSSTELDTLAEATHLEESTLPDIELPDWLLELGQPSTDEEGAPTEGGSEDETVSAEDLPDWMKDTAQLTPPAVEEVKPFEEEPAQPSEELPEQHLEMEEPVTELPAPFLDQSDQDAALAWLETLAAQHGAKEEELITKPEERSESIPDWIKLEAEEIPAAETTSQPPLGQEPSQPGEELSVEQAPAEPSSVPPAHEVDLSDQDAALAWLEALAFKHGTREEELITKPEERVETIPDWIRREAEDIQPEEAPLTPVSSEPPGAPAEELPDWIKDMAESAEEIQLSEGELEAPGYSDEELPDWFAEAGATAEAAELPETQPEIDELPDWLKGAEAPTAPPWMPEAILPETELPTPEPLAQLPPIPEEIEVAQPEEEPLPSKVLPEIIDINTASLSQLEHLPGIGFVVAQNIITYREDKGPFTSLEDLNNVPGFVPSLLEALSAQITIRIPEAAEEPALEDQTDEALFARARQAIERGDVIQASELYNWLVSHKADYDQVIADMQMALYRYPVDISLWQILGDAYLRIDKLQESLDAYIKAEELLR